MKVTRFQRLTIEGEEQKDLEGKPRRVMIDVAEPSFTGPLVPLTPYERLLKEIGGILRTRNKLGIFETIDDKVVNLTPKILSVPGEKEAFIKLSSKYGGLQLSEVELMGFRSATSSIIKSRISRGLGLHMSIEDIIAGIGFDPIVLDEEADTSKSGRESSSDSSIYSEDLPVAQDVVVRTHEKPLIRIILRKTDLVLLYEQYGNTSIKNTEDGNFAEKDNREYDYLTIGRGKIRRRSEAEVQTYRTLFKSREANTDKVHTKEVGSFVSNYEMFDTYQMLEGSYWDEPQKLRISQGKSPEEQFASIGELPSFHLASVVLRRLLAGNTFKEGQKRFRNMIKVSRIAEKISYKYSINTLFTIQPSNRDNERRAVADLSFCQTNSDIFAVGYGIYSYKAAKLPERGEVCIWSIKNPCDPERFYTYSVPVVSVEFSPYIPSLLAIGLFDGSVEVRDIAYFNKPSVAMSKQGYTPGVDPILSIKWVKQFTSGDNEEIDPFLGLCQDGSVTLFRIINSPFLSTKKLMSLKRLEGTPEGLPVLPASTEIVKFSKHTPQGLSLTMHPTQLDIYYILTDEGCIHKCSTNFQQDYLQALRTHEGSVNHMDFSPWSPKLFVTCGNDWCIRIWMDEIFEPLVTLRNSYQPYNWVAWSRTNSTILIAINRDQCEVWDLRRSVLKPVSSTTFNTSHNTLGLFSLNGDCILIGKERGQVLVNALDEMPFPPHYQYDALEKAIFNAVTDYPDLLAELKSIGYFGYPNKGFVRPT